MRDERYRLEYRAVQARRALAEDYDAIVFALGGYVPGYCAPLQVSIFPDDVHQTVLDKVER